MDNLLNYLNERLLTFELIKDGLIKRSPGELINQGRINELKTIIRIVEEKCQEEKEEKEKESERYDCYC